MARNPAATRRAMRLAGAAPVAPVPEARPVAHPVLLDVEARIYLRHEGTRGVVYNPTVIANGDSLLVALREFDPVRTPHTRIVMTSLDAGWHRGPSRVVACPDVGKLGPEDVRLFRLPDGRLAGIATIGESVDWTLALLVFDDEASSVVQVWRLGHKQKNWSPVLDGSGRLMFAPKGPVLVLEIPNRRVATDTSRMRIADTDPRGGSQLVPFGDGFVSITHELRGKGYAHRFVRYSRHLAIERLGPPFVFEAPEGIEYAAGLAYWQGRWVIAYGMADREARIAVVSPVVVDSMLGITRGER